MTTCARAPAQHTGGTRNAKGSRATPPLVEGDSDGQLIDETLQGDIQSFGRLVAKYQDRLFNAMVHIMEDRSDAEDVVQDALVRSYVKLSTFRRKSKFYTWLFRIALNTATTAKRRRRPEVSIHEMGGASRFEAVLDSPSEKCQRDERALQVRAALSSISPTLRTVLVLRDMEGCSYETISQILDVPIGTVRSRIHRGRLMLRRRLEPLLKTETAV